MRRLAVVGLLLTLVACGEEDGPTAATPAPPTPSASSSPTQKLSETEQVVDTLMRALEDGDCKTVKDVVVTPSEIDCGQVGEVAGMFAAEGTDIDRVRYEAGEVVDDSSTVKITWTDDLPTESIDVQRVDGTWLVVFDSSP